MSKYMHTIRRKQRSSGHFLEIQSHVNKHFYCSRSKRIMSKLEPNFNKKRFVESEVVKALQKEEYTLNTINIYGENLLHISTASGCYQIVNEILKNKEACKIIDRKNKFGWTPLMLAVRNRDIKMVNLFLEKGANINETTYLGMSVLGLAAAINKEMFDTVYKVFPPALLNASHDDISPLCIAAMKNDETLFFNLLDLDLEANEYTQIMMKQSTNSEISKLAPQCLDIEEYWNDTSDNIDVKTKPNYIASNSENAGICFLHTTAGKNANNNHNESTDAITLNANPVFVLEPDESDKNYVLPNLKKKPRNLNNLLLPCMSPIQKSLISPTLTCEVAKVFPASPNICFLQAEDEDKENRVSRRKEKKAHPIQDKAQDANYSKYMFKISPVSLQRLQSIRPSDLNIRNNTTDLNSTLGYTPEFSPIRSPHVPDEINENVFGENTPTPPRYKTPPRGMMLNSVEAKMIILLRRYGLEYYIPTFLEQEIDFDLFVTLTDQDLIEIGINRKSDREAILAAVLDCKKIEM